MTLRMTDAPADFMKVNVEITGFEINHESKGWISLPVVRGVYDLLSLRNNVTVVLTDHADLPIGKINQMRLILGSNNTVTDKEGQYPLTIPSGSESGLKINVDEVITSRTNLDVVMDFDANASIVQEGLGKYSLKPVLKIKSVERN
jgi:hypothetical protein